MATPVELLGILEDLADGEFKKFKWFLQQAEVLDGFPAIPRSQLDHSDRMDTVTEMKETYNKNAAEVTIKVLKLIKKNDLVQRLSNLNTSSKETLTDCHRKLKSNLRKKFQQFEQDTKSGKQMLINEIYTELDIIKEKSDEDRIQDANLYHQTVEQTINIENFFESIPGQHTSVRTLTKGVSGVGKTILTRKFVLDWTEDKLNNSIQFIFPLTFQELNLMKKRKYSWMELLHHFFADLKESRNCSFDKVPILFILDGLNECALPLDFNNSEILTDVAESASVDVLLTNLIMGKLFPTAHVWITTTPEAASQIPPEYIHMVTQVRGFTNPKKDEYIRKRFRNKKLASRIISHIKPSRSLQVMCNVPIFCWMTATVLEDMLKTDERGELPKTLTEMFIHFLLVQSKLANVQHLGRDETDPPLNTKTSKVILSLGQLAFVQLKEGNLIFFEADLVECGTNAQAASLYPGIFTQIIKENIGLNQDKCFRFVHLSFQVFLAALHVMVSFIKTGVNLLSAEHPISKQSILEDLQHLLQSAVDKALQSPNGHLNLFLHFLIGLSLQTNQQLLQDLIKQSGSSLQSTQETAQYIKKKIRENPSPERCISLFQCLNELKDHSLVEEIQQYLRSASLSSMILSPATWSDLVFILLSSESELDVFDLKKFSTSAQGLLQLLPLIQVSRVSLLRDCELYRSSYEVLGSVVSSPSANLRELDLSYNFFIDEPKFIDGLKNPHCRLETLRLRFCNLTEKSCEALASVFTSQTCSCSLRVLDLSNNNLLDSGVNFLSLGLESPHCNLETLRLSDCKLSERSCEALASALSSETSSLKELDVSSNDLQDSGVKLLSGGLKSAHCILETLRLSGCVVTEEGCSSLASALSCNPNHLKELDLSYNHPGDSGVMLLSTGVEDPQWRLDTLIMDHGGKQRLRSGLLKYACQLTLDPNTAHRALILSQDNRQVTYVEEEQPYWYHPDRFETVKQLLCENGLTGRCYWEVETTGRFSTTVTYRGINRRGCGNDCMFGQNDRSWALENYGSSYRALHNNKVTTIDTPGKCSSKIAVYLDWPAGFLSFYTVSDTLTHVHTFYTKFTEPLYPGFSFDIGFYTEINSSVSLFQIDVETDSQSNS
ncbi:NACHT, LRR and PYD domains-containing protein 3-like [Archocentrus centrarchus]|uniref:NACHT, LRR and PYD domains-containing protein 3-like n=1 Tax=Archocentrus centrarchus TaxID=63155 RepID=UPI0011E9E50D|nr:NACHT, LRR and PYD domains-containing protein 3-like [Archocentrus centrarchus]